MDTAHHVMDHWPHWYQIGDWVDAFVFQAELADEWQTRVDDLFAEMAQVQVHNFAIRSRDGTALLRLTNVGLAESVTGAELHVSQHRLRRGRSQVVVLEVAVAVLVDHVAAL